MGNRKNQVVSVTTDNKGLLENLLTGERKGTFEQGHDKLGRPYQNGFYTKEEILKDGTAKLTIKKINKV